MTAYVSVFYPSRVCFSVRRDVGVQFHFCPRVAVQIFEHRLPKRLFSSRHMLLAPLSNIN